MTRAKVEIRMGACSPQLHAQLGITEEKAEGMQKLADAITRLNLHNILTDGESWKARTRLVKQIVNELGQD